ncbi:MAG TPA: ABC transporter ATP-binding protein [Gammaproteobacteria bacterium]|jgi:iron complex transport system ATP-binding protein
MNLLEGDKLGYRIDGIDILDGIDLRLNAGEMVGLIGPNGAGKSSLVRLLAGVEAPTRGKIRFAGEPLDSWPARERARRIGYLAQDAAAHWPLSVEQIVELGRLPYQKWWLQLTAEDRERVEHALRLTETLAYRNRVVTTLSGGEQTLVMLARIFAAEPELIFADEPVAALDPYHQLHVMEVIRGHAAGNRAAIVVLHDLGLAARFCDRLYLLRHGRVHCSGTVAEVLTREHIAEVYGVDSRIVDDEQGISFTSLSRLSDQHP